MDAQNIYIKRDRMRYQKNKLFASLILLAILSNAIHFAIIYRQIYLNTKDYFFNIKMGASVLYNLIFMLVAFLSSEGVKAYKPSFAIISIVIGIIQIFRIFYYPLNAYREEIKITVDKVIETKTVLSSFQFTLITVFLSVSAVLLILSGAVTLIKYFQLRHHNKHLNPSIIKG